MEEQKKQVLQFLRSYPVMNIALVLDSKPISSVVVFWVDDDFTFYFATNSDSYKRKALVENQHISFSVWDKDKMLVQADGQAGLVPMPQADEIINKIIQSMDNIKNFWPPVVSIGEGEYIIYKIKVTWMKVLNLTNLKIREKELPFITFKF